MKHRHWICELVLFGACANIVVAIDFNILFFVTAIGLLLTTYVIHK